MTRVCDRRSVRIGIDMVLVAAAVVDAFDPMLGPLPTGLALFAAAALLTRRRWPIVVFVLTLPGLAGRAELVAALVALFTVAERTHRRSIVVLSTVAVFGVVLVTRPEDPNGGFLFSLVYALLFAVGPAGLGLLVASRAELRDKIEQLRAAREHEVQQQAALMLGQERARLASEMHDVVSHQVSLIAVRAGALQVSASRAEDRSAGDEIRELAVATLTELRSMVALLRASGAESREIAPQPRFDDVEDLIARSGLAVAAHLTFPDGAPTGVQRAVYRCVQECLTNARKHAPGAQIDVTVEPRGADIIVTVDVAPPLERPLDLPGTGSGLTGLRERAESLGGTFMARTRADGAHSVRMQLPLTG